MKLDPKGARYARHALRGCLTRLALCFDAQKKYSGAQVQEILIAVSISLDHMGEQQPPEAAKQLENVNP